MTKVGNLSVEQVEYRKSYLAGMEKFTIMVRVELEAGHYDGELQSMSLVNDGYCVSGKTFHETTHKFHTLELIPHPTKNVDLSKLKSYTQVEQVLSNGVIVHSLDVNPDYDNCQEIMSHNVYTEKVCPYDAYNQRKPIDQIATYEINLTNEEDYDSFLDVLALDENVNKDFCPTYKEWVTGKTSKGVRLGKALVKNGCSKDTIDFYAMQVKEERKVYITISDLPQHIVGMSYNNDGTWDSCQNPIAYQYDDDYALKLAGALHDDKLYIAMMHANHEDVEDIEGSVMARTLLRLVNIDGNDCLISTDYYGTHDNCSHLGKAMNMLNELDIYGNDVIDEDKGTVVYELANGAYAYEMTEEQHIAEVIEETIDIDCPHCQGSSKIDVYSSLMEKDVSVDCPMCSGSGKYETYVYHEIDEYVELVDTVSTLPYAEMYEHLEGTIKIMLDLVKIRKIREMFGNK